MIRNQSRKKNPLIFRNRANDHFLVQLGYTRWAGIPDTINTAGLSKSINVYFMFDFPFKTNPKLKYGIWPRYCQRSYCFLQKQMWALKILPPLSVLPMLLIPTISKKQNWLLYILKHRLNSGILPDPMTGKGFRAAIGIKVGTLINAHTRNTKFQNKAGNAINDFTLKEASKSFFNKTRVSAMGRVGIGHISLYGSYQLSSFI